MLTAININATRKYISKKEKPGDENPTVFHIGILDPFLRAHIEDKSTSFGLSSSNPEESASATLAMQKMNIQLVKFGVRDIENFFDPVTKETVKITLDTISIGGKAYKALQDKTLILLGGDMINELSQEVRKEQDLTGDEVKN